MDNKGAGLGALFAIMAVMAVALSACTQQKTTPAPADSPSYPGAWFSASPTYGSAPLEVTFSGNSGTFDCNGYFELDYGDGNREDVTTKTCNESFTRRHTYATAGTYTARLGPVCFEGCLPVGTVTIMVSQGQGTDNSGHSDTSVGSRRASIFTRAGDLILSYADGNVTLSGTLQRSTPCVDWKITVSILESFPEQVIFDIEDGSTAEMCIQVLGEPQGVYATHQASENALFTVRFQGEELFEGTLL